MMRQKIIGNLTLIALEDLLFTYKISQRQCLRLTLKVKDLLKKASLNTSKPNEIDMLYIRVA